MAVRPNPLLQPGAGTAWAKIEAEHRRAAASDGDTVEKRLIRGQLLSIQAARLRRSVRDGRPRGARS